MMRIKSSGAYRYHLGLAYQKLNDFGRARVELKKAMSLDPKSSVADKAREALSQDARK